MYLRIYAKLHLYDAQSHLRVLLKNGWLRCLWRKAFSQARTIFPFWVRHDGARRAGSPYIQNFQKMSEEPIPPVQCPGLFLTFPCTTGNGDV
ncbi:hypothetical protein [Nostoc sp. CMAA1605]|uniref:hypothetical protein n=1 Tax=Nostoc sp. CMAA1605 TaxID=2055159 RepID=UPI001F29BC2E|nr:hypothetical protein [Nostoc sp. CMAA1605]